MVVGEALGAAEDTGGQPFIGPAGRLLDQLLDEAGRPRKTVYVTNAVKCRAWGPSKPAPLKACRPYLMEEIEAAQPRVIVAAGGTSLKALTGKAAITRAHGTPLMLLDDYGWRCPVVGMYHPAFLLRDRSRINTALRDLKYALSLLEQRTDNLVIHYAGTDAELAQAVAAWRYAHATQPRIAIDVETDIASGVMTVFGFSISDTEAWVVPLGHTQSPFYRYWKEMLARLFGPLLLAPTALLVAHNSKFELRQLRPVLGAYPKIKRDTMLLAHLTDETEPVNLGALAARYLQAPMWKDFDDFTDTAPIADLTAYNGRDCIYTHRLCGELGRGFAKSSSARSYYFALVQPATLALAQMEDAGIFVDMQKLDTSLGELRALAEYAHKLLPSNVNYNSPAQVGKLLYEDLKLKPSKRTQTGAPSTDKLSLKRLDHPTARQILEYKKLVKLQQFLDDVGERAAWATIPFSRARHRSRIHPQYHQARVETGRLSSSDPNLQQMPRDARVRGVFGAPSGRVFASWDLSQIELRISADIANERNMKAAFADGRDIHTMTAASVLGKSTEDVTPDERTRAKSINFGFLYGMGAAGFRDYALTSFDLVFSDEEATAARQAFFRLFPGFLDYYRSVETRLRRSVILRTPIGRCRRLYSYKSSDEGEQQAALREGINFIIQSVASDICLATLIEMPSHLMAVGVVHDAILIEADASCETVEDDMHLALCRGLDRIAGLGYTLSVPIEATIKIGWK